jgi:hypothetical protein
VGLSARSYIWVTARAALRNPKQVQLTGSVAFMAAGLSMCNREQ